MSCRSTFNGPIVKPHQYGLPNPPNMPSAGERFAANNVIDQYDHDHPSFSSVAGTNTAPANPVQKSKFRPWSRPRKAAAQPEREPSPKLPANPLSKRSQRARGKLPVPRDSDGEAQPSPVRRSPRNAAKQAGLLSSTTSSGIATSSSLSSFSAGFQPINKQTSSTSTEKAGGSKFKKPAPKKRTLAAEATSSTDEHASSTTHEPASTADEHGDSTVDADEGANAVEDVNAEASEDEETTNKRDHTLIESKAWSCHIKKFHKTNKPNEITMMVPKGFNSNSDNKGSSRIVPSNALLEESWKCASRECKTGMTWYPRENEQRTVGGHNGIVVGMGRKAISHFFGRNKGQAKRIDSEVWHYYCRKHYQRDSYHGSCKDTMVLTRVQLDRIRLWRPDAKFIIQLTASGETRCNEYLRALRQNGNDKIRARAAMKKTNPTRLEVTFPPDYIEEFRTKFTSGDVPRKNLKPEHYTCTYDDIEDALDWIDDLLAFWPKELTASKNDANNWPMSIPPMEFLINEPVDNERITDPATNYRRWTCLEDGVKFDEETGTAEVDENTDSNAGIVGNDHISSSASIHEGSSNLLQGIDNADSHETDSTDYEESMTPMPASGAWKVTNPRNKGRVPLSDLEDGGIAHSEDPFSGSPTTARPSTLFMPGPSRKRKQDDLPGPDDIVQSIEAPPPKKSKYNTHDNVGHAGIMQEVFAPQEDIEMSDSNEEESRLARRARTARAKAARARINLRAYLEPKNDFNLENRPFSGIKYGINYSKFLAYTIQPDSVERRRSMG